MTNIPATSPAARRDYAKHQPGQSQRGAWNTERGTSGDTAGQGRTGIDTSPWPLPVRGGEGGRCGSRVCRQELQDGQDAICPVNPVHPVWLHRVAVFVKF